MAREEEIGHCPLPVAVGGRVDVEDDESKLFEEFLVVDNCQFVRRISDIGRMDTGYVNGAVPLADKPSIAKSGDDGDKKRRKVVIFIVVVASVLLIMSILTMIITIQMTPSIDERIRKEHEDLVRKMSEGIVKHNGSHDSVKSDNNSHR